MDRDLTALAERASDIHCRMIRGTPTEFERARLLRDMHQLTTAIRTQPAACASSAS